ncbi:MAG: protein kinase [Bacteroidota bacterium]
MIGQHVLNYKIEKLIGEGGMGNVYLGVHAHIGRKVAIKALNPVLAKNPDIRERFKNEASTLSQLHHPNIVTLFDYVETEQGIFLVMEYVEGKQLDHYIDTVTGPIPEEKAIPLFTQILDGVSYAHQRNVIHRDIKPSNIIITTEGKAKILDFGIAKILSESNHKLTKTGTKLGTVLFMSPEQVKGVEVDKRTDIYSLGITLFQTITGKSPYDEQWSEYEVYKKIVEEALPNAKEFYVGVSDRMEHVLKKATAKDLNERFNDCEEFKQALLDINFGKSTVQKPKSKDAKKPIAKTPIRQTPKVKNPRRKGWVIFWSIFFGMLFSIGLVVTSYKLIFSGTEMYVLANKLWIRSSQNLSDNNGIELLKFGDKISILKTDNTLDANGLRWAKVSSSDGKEGFVAMDYLGDKDEYQRISSVFQDNAIKDTPVVYKKAVINYLHANGMIEKDNTSSWKVNGNASGSEYNNYFLSDFNQDSKDDYACVLSDNGEKYVLLVFVSGSIQDANLKLTQNESQKIVIKKLSKGSKYFTGEYTTENRIDWYGEIYTVKAKHYETLKSDALVVWDKTNNKNTVYTFNINSNEFVETSLSQ